MPTDPTPSARGGHVNSEKAKRERKARKIETILGARIDLAEADVLDLGAGSGHLSAFFAPIVKNITAADRETDTFLPDDIEIVATPDPNLPFDNASFDAVIFNHVIEHVGTRQDQARSLSEIHRVLRPGGCLYLAVPNTWTIVEPHYRLPFLSWLPARLADAWVRRTGQNDWYDCTPFSHPQIKRAISDAGFACEDVTGEAFYRFLEIEKADTPLGKILQRAPKALVNLSAPIMPTLIMIARKQP